MTDAWLYSPILRDVAKHTMLDFVPLARRWWKVTRRLFRRVPFPLPLKRTIIDDAFRSGGAIVR
ncbi:MAG: hypothetical protein ACI8ZW_001947 [Yoonia sp.]|jgi:hypothetical protein